MVDSLAYFPRRAGPRAAEREDPRGGRPSVPGSAFVAPPAEKHGTPAGVSFMPGIYADTLDPKVADELVAYLLTLR